MSTSYDTIFDKFENKIEDVVIYNMDDDDKYDMYIDYLDTAIAELQLNGVELGSDLDDRNDNKMIFNVNLSSLEINIISLEMVVVWYEQKLNSLQLNELIVGTKEERYTNQREHSRAMLERYESFKKRLELLIKNYNSRNNSYLGDD